MTEHNNINIEYITGRFIKLLLGLIILDLLYQVFPQPVKPNLPSNQPITHKTVYLRYIENEQNLQATDRIISSLNTLEPEAIINQALISSTKFPLIYTILFRSLQASILLFLFFGQKFVENQNRIFKVLFNNKTMLASMTLFLGNNVYKWLSSIPTYIAWVDHNKVIKLFTLITSQEEEKLLEHLSKYL